MKRSNDAGVLLAELLAAGAIPTMDDGRLRVDIPRVSFLRNGGGRSMHPSWSSARWSRFDGTRGASVWRGVRAER